MQKLEAPNLRVLDILHNRLDHRSLLQSLHLRDLQYPYQEPVLVVELGPKKYNRLVKTKHAPYT